MHVHYWVDDHDGVLFVAHGVTRVRNMHGEPVHLSLRERIASGELIGPEIVTTGPALDGTPVFQPNMIAVDTPEQARAEIAREAAEGLTMVKIYSGLAPDVYAAIVEAAAEHGMSIMGHVPDQVGVAAAAALQRSNEHLMTYDLAGNHADQVAATVDGGMWNCPTIVAWERVTRLDELRRTGIEGDAYVAPSLRELWTTSLEQVDLPLGSVRQVTQDLSRAGAGLLVGTDANVSFLVPGWSMHDELQYLVDAGLTPYETLRAATYNAAGFLDDLDRTGTVEVGRAADLVLLDGDPLADISHTRQPAGVMLRGRWYPAEELSAMLEEVRRARSSEAAATRPPRALPWLHAH